MHLERVSTSRPLSFVRTLLFRAHTHWQGADGLQGYRCTLAVFYLVLLGLTWPLWNPRTLLPTLPWLPLPELPWAFPLGISILWAALEPRRGAVVHLVVLSLALLSDQLRLQPFVWSLSLLLCTARPTPGATWLARNHLLALWFWAGLHKALSPAFFASTAPWLWSPMPGPLQTFAPYVGYLFAGTEMFLGCVGWVRPARRPVAFLGCAMHLCILALISRPSLGSNTTLWPWNLSLALASIQLLQPWKLTLRDTFRALPSWPVRVLPLVLWLMPAGYYGFEFSPALAQVLYTGSVPETVWCTQTRFCRADVEQKLARATLGVIIPPTATLLQRTFQALCIPGETLYLHDPRRDDSPTPVTSIPCARGHVAP